jgi:hypothetical protein
MGLMRNKVYRLNEVILFFAKAQKPQIASLLNGFCNVGKGQKNKFKYKVYFVSSPMSGKKTCFPNFRDRNYEKLK